MLAQQSYYSSETPTTPRVPCGGRMTSSCFQRDGIIWRAGAGVVALLGASPALAAATTQAGGTYRANTTVLP